MTYSPDYKLRILTEYDSLDRTGKGELLRREGLYSSLLSQWRRQRDEAALEGLSRHPGRAPTSDTERELAQLRAENDRLKAEIAKTRRLVDAQKKLFALLQDLAGSSAKHDSESET
jgi:transposase